MPQETGTADIIERAVMSPATELGTGDGGSDGDVETLGSRARGVVVGNEQLVGDELANGWGDAVALVAHDDDTIGGELLLVDVLAIE